MLFMDDVVPLQFSCLIRVVGNNRDSLSLFGYFSKHLPYVGLILQCFYQTQLAHFSVYPSGKETHRHNKNSSPDWSKQNQTGI